TVGSSPPAFQDPVFATTATGQVIYTGQVGTTAILQLRSTGNAVTTLDNCITGEICPAEVTLAIHVPPAVRIAMSQDQGDHSTSAPVGLSDGFNNGNTTITMATVSQTTTLSISFSSYDMYNWLTATNGNATVGTQTTTFT